MLTIRSLDRISHLVHALWMDFECKAKGAIHPATAVLDKSHPSRGAVVSHCTYRLIPSGVDDSKLMNSAESHPALSNPSVRCLSDHISRFLRPPDEDRYVTAHHSSMQADLNSAGACTDSRCAQSGYLLISHLINVVPWSAAQEQYLNLPNVAMRFSDI